MAVKKFKPASAGSRFRVGSSYAEVTTGKPEKSLMKGTGKSGGRNNQGRMTMRYLGGGHKRRYRVIDFKRNKHGVPATVKSIEYDPNRTAYIALLYYADGEKRYILAPEGLKEGQTVMSGEKATPEVGNAMFLRDVPFGSVIHNVELNPGKGGQMARTAGSYAQLDARDGKYAIVKLPSGETRMVLQTCMATIGTVSNSDHGLLVLAKAGRKRWLGRRPRTRGVAMNPIDHPMGGGEGRASGGQPRSRTGVYSKGLKTRKPNKASERFIISRKKKNKGK